MELRVTWLVKCLVLFFFLVAFFLVLEEAKIVVSHFKLFSMLLKHLNATSIFLKFFYKGRDWERYTYAKPFWLYRFKKRLVLELHKIIDRDWILKFVDHLLFFLVNFFNHARSSFSIYARFVEDNFFFLEIEFSIGKKNFIFNIKKMKNGYACCDRDGLSRWNFIVVLGVPSPFFLLEPNKWWFNVDSHVIKVRWSRQP